MMNRVFPTTPAIALTAIAAVLSPAPVSAEFLGRSADDVVQVTLVEGWRMSETRHMAGIRIDLAPGWKTYWRAPGEGGVPTQLHLTDAVGIAGLAIHWPSPEVFVSNGMRSIGYREDVVLPVELLLSGDGPYRIEGQIELGVCLDVCMPVSLDISGVFDADGARDAAIGAALSDRPLTATEAGAGQVRCAIEPISDGLRVTVSAPLQPTGNDETMVVEHADAAIWVSEAVSERQGGMLVGVADIVPPDHGPFALNRSDLRVTVIGSRMTVDLGGCTG